MTYFAVSHQFKGILGAPPIHAFCPFGGLESLFKLLVSGNYIQKIFPATMVLFAATIAMAILLNRVFCGWVCPLGLLQEFFTKIGRKLKVKQNSWPRPLDRYLKYVKYIGLFIIIYFTWKTGTLVFAPYDPWAAYGHIAGGFADLYNEFLIGTLFLIIGMVGSIWITQNWCKYFCPMGAMLAIFSKFSPTRIVRDTDTCINCNTCSKVCPVSIDVSKLKEIRNAECYQCGDCIEKCPKPSLEYRTIGNRKLSWLVYGLAGLLIFFGSVYTAKAMRIWDSGYGSVGEVLMDDGGKLNPMNIRGGLSIVQVSEAFGIPPDEIRNGLGIKSQDDNSTLFRDLIRKYPFSMMDVRMFVHDYLKSKE